MEPKKRTNLGFLNGTNKPAILIEVCFVDSKGDVQIYKNKFDEICIAIAHLFKSVDESYPDIECIEYFVKLGKTYCEFYTDRELQEYKGHLLISWFTDFEEIGRLPVQYTVVRQLTLFEKVPG
ncbi:hypothetical protein [Metabacillus fastidiosus]|uniref:hypothetical protein n=1 Tax=Metabacillus fastidiosus TaxID=1458 RepID=UPI003D2D0B1E